MTLTTSSLTAPAEEQYRPMTIRRLGHRLWYSVESEAVSHEEIGAVVSGTAEHEGPPPVEDLLASPTSPLFPPDDLESEITSLFQSARDEDFECGMESDFARKLVRLVKQHGNAAIETICQLIVYERTDPVTANEALVWLATMEDSQTYGFRRWLLERSLFLSSHWVRDGAGVGLAAMDDPRAIPQIRKAIETERCPDLRQDLGHVLRQLEATERCRTTSSAS